jgi:flagellar export protein FliJ
MTRFHFRLQRVLEWREKQLELEEARYKQQAAEIVVLDQARAELESTRLRAETGLRASTALSGYDLSALSGFRLCVQARSLKLAARRGEAQKRLESQQAAMLEARRRCRLLEHLKSRRLSEWEAARDKELDELASESYLALWVRREPRAPSGPNRPPQATYNE